MFYKISVDGLTNTCSNDTGFVRVGKYLSDILRVHNGPKQRDDLSSLFCKFALE